MKHPSNSIVFGSVSVFALNTLAVPNKWTFSPALYVDIITSSVKCPFTNKVYFPSTSTYSISTNLLVSSSFEITPTTARYW